MTDILTLMFRNFSRKEAATAASLPATRSSVAARDPDTNRSSSSSSSVVLGDPDRSSVVLGDPDRSSVVLGDPDRSSVVLGDPDRSSVVVLGDPDRSSVVLGDPDRSSVVLGDPDRSSVVVLGDPDRSSVVVLGDPDRSSVVVLGDPDRSSVVVGDPDRSSVVVLGDPELSRSLLLLAAVTAASDCGLRVMFFTQTQIQSLPLCLQRCFPGLSPDSLKKIGFWYPRTLEELLLQISSLHESTNTTPTPPSLLIVDRLQGYLGPAGGSHAGPGEQSRAAHLSALLSDSAAFLTRLLERRRPSSAPCRVLASYWPEVREVGEAETSDPVLGVLDRYFQVRCTLDRVRDLDRDLDQDQDRDQDQDWRPQEVSGVQDVWKVFLSDTDVSSESPRRVREWLLSVSHDGFMDFRSV